MSTILATIPDGVEATYGDLPKWQQAMRAAVRSGDELLRMLDLPVSEACPRAAVDFPVFVPREFLSRMRRGDLNDPLLQQVLAKSEEVSDAWTVRGVGDPVGDEAATRSPGLLQKYAGRALLVMTGACAIHCRYCFRRHYPYEQAPKGIGGWQAALDLIRDDSNIEEVILSGGDPLTVADSQLSQLIQCLNAIEHVRRVRVHTRVPIVIPQRVCDELIEWVQACRAAVYFVMHINHPQEIDDHVQQAINRLRKCGVTLLNQAVLLRGVNDSAEVQLNLCRELVDMQVLPYYLHQLDRVAGAVHFEVADDAGRAIIEHLRSNLPGYAVPKLVREIAGEPSKTAL